MDFIAARLLGGRWFRVLTVVDQFTRECLLLLADSSLTGQKAAMALSLVIAERGAPASITADNGTEFCSRAMESWAYQYRVQLDFIRPGSPTENGYIESFNGRSRDECRCARIAPWAIALPRSSLHSGRLPRRPRRKHFRRRRENPPRAKYWSLSIESVECTNCRPGRLKPDHPGRFLYFRPVRICGTGHGGSRSSLLLYILQVSLECAARIRGLAVYPLISNEVLGYDAAESASKMSYDRLPRFLRCD